MLWRALERIVQPSDEEDISIAALLAANRAKRK